MGAGVRSLHSQRCGHETALWTSVGQPGVLVYFATGKRRGGPCSGTRNFRSGLVGHISKLDWCLVEELRAGPLFANGLADAIYDPKSWVSVGLCSPSRGSRSTPHSVFGSNSYDGAVAFSVRVLALRTFTPVDSNLLAMARGGQNSAGCGCDCDCDCNCNSDGDGDDPTQSGLAVLLAEYGARKWPWLILPCHWSAICLLRVLIFS